MGKGCVRYAIRTSCSCFVFMRQSMPGCRFPICVTLPSWRDLEALDWTALKREAARLGIARIVAVTFAAGAETARRDAAGRTLTRRRSSSGISCAPDFATNRVGCGVRSGISFLLSPDDGSSGAPPGSRFFLVAACVSRQVPENGRRSGCRVRCFRFIARCVCAGWRGGCSQRRFEANGVLAFLRARAIPARNPRCTMRLIS